MFALAFSKDICHTYGKHIVIKPLIKHNIVYSQRKKLTIWCKFLDIENSVSYNSDTMCGHGGIGRRVRLRGVWDDRVSSSLTGRTKKKNQVNRLGFFYATCGLCVLKTHAPMARTHTPRIVTLRFLSKLNRYAITDTPFTTTKQSTLKHKVFEVGVRSGHSRLPRCIAPQLVVLHSKGRRA